MSSRSLTYKAFSLLQENLSWLGRVVFIFVVILSIKVKPLNYSHRFYYSSFYCAVPILNVSHNSYVESPKITQCVFCSPLCVCIFFFPEQWKHCTKQTHLCLPCTLIPTHPTIFSTFIVLVGKERQKGEGVLLCLCVLFAARGSTTTKKGHSRAPWPLVFLRTPLPSFCVWGKFWLEWKTQPLGVASALSLLFSHDGTHLPCATLSLSELPWGWVEGFARVMNILWQWNGKEG